MGADGQDVAIFQGVPLSVLGIDLGWVVERTNVPADQVAALQETYPTFEDGIPVADREAARALVEQMHEDVRRARLEEQEGGGGTGGGGG